MIYIRADANPNIGMGHIMRCLSIADAFYALGHSPVFILADENVLSLVTERGYKAIVLHSDYSDMEAELQLWEEKGIAAADFILVDSYYVTASYLQSLKAFVGKKGKRIYLDDFAAFPYPVDILVNYNAYAGEALYRSLYKAGSVALPQLILGYSYAPLRPMFRGVRKKEQPETVKNVLLSTGGADPLHLSLSVLRALLESEEKAGYVYHFLLGEMNVDKEKIRTLARGQDRFVLHENVTDMRGLLEGMDLAVSAAGSTLYEICACGIPLITYILADNQIPGAEAFHSLGLAVNIGDLREVMAVGSSADTTRGLSPFSVQRILSAVEQKSADYAWRADAGNRMQEMIDGLGADRLVRRMKEIGR